MGRQRFSSRNKTLAAPCQVLSLIHIFAFGRCPRLVDRLRQIVAFVEGHGLLKKSHGRWEWGDRGARAWGSRGALGGACLSDEGGELLGIQPQVGPGSQTVTRALAIDKSRLRARLTLWLQYLICLLYTSRCV